MFKGVGWFGYGMIMAGTLQGILGEGLRPLFKEITQVVGVEMGPRIG